MADASEARKDTAETAQNVRNRFQNSADKASASMRESGERATEAAGQAAGATADFTRRTAREARDAAVLGMRALADAQAPLVNASYEEGRRLLENTARVTDVYREAADRTSGDMHALISSYTRLGRGVQEMQHAYFDLLRLGLDRLQRKPQDIWRARSMVEIAEVQRDLFTNGLETGLSMTSTLLQLSAKIVQEAMQPLQERSHPAHT
jgi:hypothetical protein